MTSQTKTAELPGHLSLATIASIAAKYDLDPEESLVRANAEQAVKYHGSKGTVGHWACDRSGYYDAARLLDGYLAEETRAARCEALKHRDFREAAYGDA